MSQLICSATFAQPSRCWVVALLVMTWSLVAMGVDDTALTAHCARFHAYEAGIAEDLLPWYDDTGISEALMDRTLQELTMSNRVPGLPLCIRGGKLYVIDGSNQRISNLWEWQADNIVVYAHALRRLVARWGSALPDAEFVVETQDVPCQDLHKEAAEGRDVRPGGMWSEPHGRLPVMRHCKTAASLDITVPIFHFYTMHYDEQYLAAIDRFNREYPWEARKHMAFAAGTSYHRDQTFPGTTRAWDGSREGQLVQEVRAGFSEYLTSELRHPNITYSPGSVPMDEWVRYRMVMHVDGITCSSRLWQLLALGSVVLREQSGYFAFYDKLLARFIHYVPFWSHRPREVVWAYNWVSANDEAARRIASRGQMFAREYLNREGVECFWVLLLRQYSRLLRFTPGQRPASRVTQLGLMPIDDWLQSQDGLVTSWDPHKVTTRGEALNLLPLP